MSVEDKTEPAQSLAPKSRAKPAKKEKTSKSPPTDIDLHLGRRIRMRRTLLGLNQHDLAKALKVTFQQVQKYERGVNRMSVSSLLILAKLLKVPVQYFYDGLPVSDSQTLSEPPAAETRFVVDVFKRETLDLVRYFYQIDSAEVRAQVLALGRAMAEAYGKKDED